MNEDLPAGFARHNIDHLSASSINLWTNAPDVWVAEWGERVKGGAVVVEVSAA